MKQKSLSKGTLRLGLAKGLYLSRQRTDPASIADLVT